MVWAGHLILEFPCAWEPAHRSGAGSPWGRLIDRVLAAAATASTSVLEYPRKALEALQFPEQFPEFSGHGGIGATVEHWP